MNSSLRLTAVAAAALFFSAALSARAETWVGPAPSNGSLGGVWNTATNWSPASVPNAAGASAVFTDVNVTANRAYTFSADTTIGSLSIDNSTIRTNIWSVVDQVSPSLTFDSGGAGPATVTITGTNGGTANSNIIRGAVILNSNLIVTVPDGTTTSAAGEFSFNRGVLSGSGGVTKNGSGTMTYSDAGDKSYSGATVINAGRLRLNGAAKITGTSGITVNPGGQFVLDGSADWTFGADADTLITLNGHGQDFAEYGSNPIGYFPGAIRTGSGQLTYIENKIVLASDSSINVISTNPVSSKGILNLMNTVSGAGRLFANKRIGATNREGFLNLAHSNTYSGGTIVEQGTLTVTDDYNLDANTGTGNVFVDGSFVSTNPVDTSYNTYGKMVLEANLTDAIPNTSYLYVTGGGAAGTADIGYLQIDGALNETVGGLMVGGVQGVGGLILGAGTYGSTASGAANPGLSNPDEYFTGSGTVTVVPSGVPGDYNNNGVVDAGDYVLWRKGGPLAHDFTPGVQSTDYDFWRSRIGATTNPASGSGLTNSAVPEPSTCALAAFVASLLLVGRRRRFATGR